MPNTDQYPCFQVLFDGAVLRRGFWLYVCKITCDNSVLFYVGMTGDRGKGTNASSAFARIGTHLGKNPNNNTIMKKLTSRRIDPFKCSFTLLAIGPLFQEQTNKESHVSLCDQVEALEKALMKHIEERKYEVINQNRRCEHEPDQKVLTEVIRIMDSFLPKSI